MRFYVDDFLFEVFPTSKEKELKSNQTTIFSASSAEQVIENYQLVRSGNIQGKTSFAFLVSDYQQECNKIKSYFKIIKAAGGIVEKDAQILMIFRLKKWDLPKGKMEERENPEFTAVREVEEECGIKAEIIDRIGETWHTYDIKGKSILKCTYWFYMKSNSDSTPIPQTEEAIEAVKWVAFSEASKLLKNGSYASIKDIYNKFESLK